MIHTQDPDFTLYQGDCVDVLRDLPASSVHCCVTSPPYWGLRDYGTGTWDGGDPDCDHLQPATGGNPLQGPNKGQNGGIGTPFKNTCGLCSATRVDQQLGLEQTPDEYVARMVDVFREVRRVLRDDGSLWLNIGDSYNAARDGGHAGGKAALNSGRDIDAIYQNRSGANVKGLKPKDLVGIPWRLAFALQADGWWLRSDIIWSKPNPMPESVTDRPTKAHEYVFLLTKSARYYFDQEAVRESYTDPREGGDGFRWNSDRYTNQTGPQSNHTPTGRGPDGRRVTKVEGRDGSEQHRNGERWPHPAGRNVRSVWEIATQPYPEAHFATFPQELARRCIAAGTSEHGCCPECGAPWERQISVDTSLAESRRGTDDYQSGGIAKGATWAGTTPGVRKNVTTTGWAPSCAHGHQPTPCTVLDPFIGSGTTALVARNQHRRSIGIELNPDYCQLAARRLQQQTLFA